MDNRICAFCECFLTIHSHRGRKLFELKKVLLTFVHKIHTMLNIEIIITFNYLRDEKHAEERRNLSVECSTTVLSDDTNSLP